MEKIYDVIIAGCGPTGAGLANYLGKHNLNVLIFDKESDIIDYPRAVHIDEDVIRIFQELGLYEKMKKNAIKPFVNYSLVSKKDKLLFQFQPKSSISENIPDCNWILQPEIEKHLRDELLQYSNVTLLKNTTWKELNKKEDSVSLVLIKDKKELVSVKAKFLIACDGSKSGIRKEMNIDIHDFGFKKEWFVIDANYNGKDFFSEDHKQICDPNQPITYVNGVRNHFRWEFMVSKQHARLSDEMLAEIMIPKLASGFPIDDFEVIRKKKYVFHTLIARNWRSGRIFLAGDAAHLMPPFLGQGMCSGLKDAKNLAWKINIACTEFNVTTDELLDSYYKERAPQVSNIIRVAAILGGFIQCSSPILAFFRNGFLRLLNIFPRKPIDKLIEKHLYGLEVKNFSRYKHPLVGKRIPQPLVVLKDKRVVYFDELCGFYWVVLFRSDSKIVPSKTSCPLKYISIAENLLESPQDIKSIFFSKWMMDNNADFVVIRPDKYIFDIGKAENYDEIISRVVYYVNKISVN